MQKDITTMYNRLASAEMQLQKLKGKWLQAIETDVYYAYEVEVKLDTLKDKIIDCFATYFNITISDDYELIWN